MRILQLCNKFPYPPRDGGAIAALNVSKAFARQGHDVTVLAMNTNKHYYDPKDVPEELAREVDFHSVRVNTEVRITDAVWSLFLNRSYHVQRFVSADYAVELVRVLREQGPYDVVQLEGLYLTPYIPLIRAHSAALVSLRAHNIECQIWERIAAQEPRFLRRQYVRVLSKQLKLYEQQQINKVDVLVPISPVDAERFRGMGYQGLLHVAPASFDEEELIPADHALNPKNVFYLGALDWAPNVDGLKWFIKDVWWKVLSRQPHLVLQIAGRNMPDDIKAMRGPRVQVLGEVTDAVEFMNLNHVMIVPLFSGSGMRVKIIEGMALGKVIVTTPIGAEGIGGKDGDHFLLATTPDDFARQIIRCLEDPILSKHISESAWKFAREHYGSMPCTKALVAFYENCVRS